MATGRIIRPRTQDEWDLLTPGRKPNGPVRINWNHPLSQGLKHAILLDTDLVTMDDLELSGSIAWQDNKIVGTSGNALVSSATIAGEELTALVRYKPANVTADNVIFGNLRYGSVNVNDGWGIRQLNAEIRIESYNNASTRAVFTSVLQAGIAKTYIGTFQSAASARKLFVDGVEISKSSSTGTAVPKENLFKVGIFKNNGDFYFSSNAACQGTVDIALAWDRILSDEEIAEINRNPYALIRPANDTPFLYSITGGATVTLSSPTATVTGPTTATVGCTVTYT